MSAKHRREGARMNESEKKPYALVTGMVQAFTKDGVKQAAVRAADVNGQTVHNFTVKTPNNNYVDIALWSEYAAVAPNIAEGFMVFADGQVSQREHNGKVYTTVSAKRLCVIPCVQRVEREVVNAAPVAAAPAAAPVAEAAPAAPAAAQPFTF